MGRLHSRTSAGRRYTPISASGTTKPWWCTTRVRGGTASCIGFSAVSKLDPRTSAERAVHVFKNQEMFI